MEADIVCVGFGPGIRRVPHHALARLVNLDGTPESRAA
jgi:hypothetical protein